VERSSFFVKIIRQFDNWKEDLKNEQKRRTKEFELKQLEKKNKFDNFISEMTEKQNDKKTEYD